LPMIGSVPKESNLPNTVHLYSSPRMTPEDRARAVVAYFPAIPPKIRADVEAIVTRAIKRALTEQLGRLELEAMNAADKARGRGKQAKGRDPAAIHYHSMWQRRFRSLRTGKEVPEDLVASGWYRLWQDWKDGF
jgi:hypothetical protein